MVLKRSTNSIMNFPLKNLHISQNDVSLFKDWVSSFLKYVSKISFTNRICNLQAGLNHPQTGLNYTLNYELLFPLNGGQEAFLSLQAPESSLTVLSTLQDSLVVFDEYITRKFESIFERLSFGTYFKDLAYGDSNKSSQNLVRVSAKANNSSKSLQMIQFVFSLLEHRLLFSTSIFLEHNLAYSCVRFGDNEFRMLWTKWSRLCIDKCLHI